MKKKLFFICLTYFVLLLIIYRGIFTLSQIAGGDYITFWPENINYLVGSSFASWDSSFNLGSSTLDTIHSALAIYLFGMVGNMVGQNSIVLERLIWWAPFFILSFISAFFLLKKTFPSTLTLLISVPIFLFNTYVFMIIGGGQIAGVGLAYAITPLIFTCFIMIGDAINEFVFEKVAVKKIIKDTKLLRLSILTGLLVAIQIIFDLRIAYVTICGVIVYLFILIIFLSRKTIPLMSLSVFYFSLIPFGIASVLHSFWIIPAFFFSSQIVNHLGPAYNTLDSVKFLSFAKLENTLSLLHPNWPENIFGKVSFMKPEFLLLPILAYGSLLLFQEKREKVLIIFFAILGLFGSFLAKGANEPFGGLYLWMFVHIPAFVMFRDPTKWYVLIAISYMILIPFTVWKLYEKLSVVKKISISGFIITTKSKYINFQNIFLLFIVLYLLFLMYPAFFSQLGGTFISSKIPKDYINLRKFLSSDTQFSRVLWVPEKQRFGFWSNVHPAVWSYDLFHNASISGVLKELKNPKTQTILEEASIKYLIVPGDSQKEIFITDRKYDKKLEQKTKEEISHIGWFKSVSGFGNNAVFVLSSAHDHFWSPNKNVQLNYSIVSNTEYLVTVSQAKKGDMLVFSEAFDPEWEEKGVGSTYKQSSSVFDGKFNSFQLPKDGNYTIVISYKVQQWVDVGIVISLIVFVFVCGVVVVLRSQSAQHKRRKKKAENNK